VCERSDDQTTRRDGGGAWEDTITRPRPNGSQRVMGRRLRNPQLCDKPCSSRGSMSRCVGGHVDGIVPECVDQATSIDGHPARGRDHSSVRSSQGRADLSARSEIRIRSRRRTRRSGTGQGARRMKEANREMRDVVPFVNHDEYANKTRPRRNAAELNANRFNSRSLRGCLQVPLDGASPFRSTAQRHSASTSPCALAPRSCPGTCGVWIDVGRRQYARCGIS
jgi:hypothetical protein